MTFAQLRAFVTVADRGTFTAAAAHLIMTQSAVSHALRALEDELGFKLFLRHGGAVRLTAAGEASLPHARAILAEIAALRGAAPPVRDGRSQLRIGCVRSAAERLLPGILAPFTLVHPGVSVVQLNGSDPEVCEWLETSAVEVAIFGDHFSSEAEPLFRDELKAVVPADHQLASNDSVSMEALAGVPFIMSASGCEPMISALAQTNGAQLRIHYYVRDMPSLMRMVADGLGVTIVPSLNLPTPENVRVLKLRPRAYRQLVIATNEDATPSQIAVAFLHHARQWAQANDVPHAA